MQGILFLASALMLAFCSTSVGAQGSELLQAPSVQAVERGSAVVLRGSLCALEASGEVVVKRVRLVGGDMVIVLHGAGKAADVSIKLSGVAADGLTLAAGTPVNIFSISTGFLLSSAGEVITFIPNELGKSLFYPA